MKQVLKSWIDYFVVLFTCSDSSMKLKFVHWQVPSVVSVERNSIECVRRFDDDYKTKYVYSLNHHEGIG